MLAAEADLLDRMEDGRGQECEPRLGRLYGISYQPAAANDR
jgi:hypothetical protein